MAYNKLLSQRIADMLTQKHIIFEEKVMMGGWTTMVDDKMCVGVIKDDLMARVGREEYDHLLQTKLCRPMNFTGKEMRGYLLISEADLSAREDLEFWIDKCLEFNPRAKSSRKI